MESFWETIWGEDEIEMPPEPASTSAAVDAASTASDDAFDRWYAVRSTYQTAKDAWVDAAEAESKLHAAVDEADADNVAGTRTAYEIADAQEDIAYETWQALDATVTEDVDAAYKSFQAAHNAEVATRAIDEGWHKAKAIADEAAAGEAAATDAAALEDADAADAWWYRYDADAASVQEEIDDTYREAANIEEADWF